MYLITGQNWCPYIEDLLQVVVKMMSEKPPKSFSHSIIILCVCKFILQNNQFLWFHCGGKKSALSDYWQSF